MKITSKNLLAGALAFIALPRAMAAEVKVAPYGETSNGLSVHAYTLINDKGASATILDFGGTITAINVPDRNGHLGNVVMAFSDITAWEKLGYANAIIGRVANRIANGFTLDGVHYNLKQTNEQGVTMHGGPPAYTTRVWQTEPISKKDGAKVTLTLDSPDGDQGFPGHVKVKTVYSFGNDNALRMDLTAITDKPTIINLTNHIYFNLSGNSTVPVSDHTLQVAADRYMEAESGKGPTGKILAVTGTPDDFTRPTRIGDRVALSLSAAYDNAATAPPVPAGMRRSFNEAMVLNDDVRTLKKVAVRLVDPLSGRVLEMRTDEVSIQVFTPATMRDGLLSDAGKAFTRMPSIALEAEHLPDSPNFPQFPTVVLRPGETFKSTTIYGFTTRTKH